MKRNLVRWFATVLLLGVAFSAQAIDCPELPNSLDGSAGDMKVVIRPADFPRCKTQ